MTDAAALAARHARVRAALAAEGLAGLLVGASASLTYLTGLEPPIPTRMTLLVVPAEGEPRLLVPALERPDDGALAVPLEVVSWTDGEDAAAAAARLVPAGALAVDDRLWARDVLALQAALPAADMRDGGPFLASLRAVKDDAELEALAAASACVDRVVGSLAEMAWVGRSEREIARELHAALADAGHDGETAAIVAAGPSGAHPHHLPGGRAVAEGDVVVVDIGGRRGGYWSDTTRTLVVDDPPAGFDEVYAAVRRAHEAGRAAVRPGAVAADVDAAARAAMADAGLGDRFVHRTGHGIGLDEHERPSLQAGDTTPLVPGTAFTVEPGAYLPGRFGCRLEDVVVVTAGGERGLNATSHEPIRVPG